MSVQLQKGQSYELTGKEFVTISIDSEFPESTFVVTLLNKKKEVIKIRSASTIGGSSGNLSWNVNPARDEKMLGVAFPQLDEEICHLIFFVVPDDQGDKRRSIMFRLCDETGKDTIAQYRFENLNGVKSHMGMGLHRQNDGSWSLIAIGESSSETELSALSKSFGVYCGRPKVIFVKVVAGRKLAAMDAGGTSDVYVIVRANRTVQRTETIKKTLDPTFAEGSFRIPYWSDVMPPARGGSLKFDVFDWDKFSKDDFMGIVEIPVKDVCEGDIDDWYPLQADDRIKAKKVKGDLHVQLKLLKEDEK